ncbi:hypothetical protein TTHERM_00295780 (macronuclear) [Tetrahymena thermophila SB210]|uniref:Uncharacterized protein n=1 Tax=Tetrahymena thermophila (strain SB210) TaxID=312017 RepID=I7MDY7_TETTS|nr:hypothetical protein TTHERM_00295780 [Tetrahymena thermophila SB210]EAR92965.2 hypothetical protein TTHERM_00295780 [Tetrahymena thermophila SB210]|eukprot:XP_001013210.2 hypothetical protein TTHERM_00295780 [Tetrahymena thermophila SB210]
MCILYLFIYSFIIFIQKKLIYCQKNYLYHQFIKQVAQQKLFKQKFIFSQQQQANKLITEMILQREGREVDEATYIKSSDAMQRMQRIADRLISVTPEISKFLPQDSVLRTNKISAIQNKNEVLQQNINNKNLQKIREITTGLPPMKAEMSSEDVRQRALDIEQLLETQKQENEKLKNDLENRKDRYVQRELEYRKIIEELQNEIRQKAVLDLNEAKKMELATRYHQEILDRISKLQVKTSNVLIDQEKTVIRFFNDKIQEIKKQFEDERIKKGKKDQDYIQRENQLISELEWIENIAQKIDNENINLMKKFMDLQAQYQTQENDRDMLLKELIMKKKQNAILKSQIENYEKMLSQVQKEEENEEQEERNKNQISHLDNQNNFLQQSNHNQSQQDDISVASSKKKSLNQSQNIRIRTTKSTNWVMKKYQQQQNSDQKDTSQLQKSTQFKQNYNIVNNPNMDQSSLQLQINEKKIKEIQAQLRQEQKRIRELKQSYVKELLQKSDLEKIIRKSVEDIKEEIIQLKGENRVILNSQESQVIRDKRDIMIDKLLNNEKILTLIYDKTFYPESKNIDANFPDEDIDPEILALRLSKKTQQDNKIYNLNEIDHDIEQLE